MKRDRTLIFLTLGLIVLGIVVHTLFAHDVVRAAYAGESLSFLNDILDRHRSNKPDTRHLVFYLERVDGLLGVYVLACVWTLLIALALRNRDRTREMFSRFFLTPSGPLNLAVFRVILFAYIIENILNARTQVFARLPADFIVPPIPLEGLVPLLPFDETTVSLAVTASLVFAATAMVGLFTRTSALLTTLLCLYVLGIPQFYGKVHHYHHILWFAAVLSASRCGDALSVDAAFRALRQANRGNTDPPPPSIQYSLPIRFIWILMGVVYFFPGFLKLYYSGFPWAFSDNVVTLMHHKWFEIGGWVPFIRWDQVPVFPQIGAFITMLWEAFFVLMIFHPTMRIVAATVGAVFHISTGMMMSIWFNSLWACYISFINIEWVLRRLGARMFPSDATLVYDSDCRSCRRVIALMRAFDFLARVRYVKSADGAALSELDIDASQPGPGHLLFVSGGTSRTGIEAYRGLAPRFPVAWPAIPLLYLLPLLGIGGALSRNHQVRDTVAMESSSTDTRTAAAPPRTLVAVGSVFVGLATLAGVINVYSAWPFAVYPSFAGIAGPELATIAAYTVDADDVESEFSFARARETFGPTRFEFMLRRIQDIANPEEQRRQLALLWDVLNDIGDGVAGPVRLRFYSETFLVDPDHARRDPTHRELLFEFDGG